MDYIHALSVNVDVGSILYKLRYTNLTGYLQIAAQIHKYCTRGKLKLMPKEARLRYSATGELLCDCGFFYSPSFSSSLSCAPSPRVSYVLDPGCRSCLLSPMALTFFRGLIDSRREERACNAAYARRDGQNAGGY